MFKCLWRKLRLAHQRKKHSVSRSRRDLSPNLEANLTAFQEELGLSDLIIRRLTLGPRPGVPGLYLSTASSINRSSTRMLLPLLNEGNWGKGQDVTDLLGYVAQSILAVGEMQRKPSFAKLSKDF